jgi:hypothetical protein
MSKPTISDICLRKFEQVSTSNLPKGVLAVLQGICMEIEQVNENNRFYPRPLVMNKIINNDDTNHLMKHNALIGEGCHPMNRFYTEYPKAAILVKRIWIPEEDQNHLHIEFWVLDTPVGRILKTLIDVGSSIGISIRAAGTSTERDGVDYMNEEDYTFFTFDAVPEPGFKSARPIPVNESKILGKEIKDYSELELEQTKALLESLNPEFFTEQITQIQGLQEKKEPPAEADVDALLEAHRKIASLETALQIKSRPTYPSIPDSVVKKVNEQVKNLATVQVENKRLLLENARLRKAQTTAPALEQKQQETTALLTNEQKAHGETQARLEQTTAQLTERTTELSEAKAQLEALPTLQAEVRDTKTLVGSQKKQIDALEQKTRNDAKTLYETRIRYLSAQTGIPVTQVQALIPKFEKSPDKYIQALTNWKQKKQAPADGSPNDTGFTTGANEGLLKLVKANTSAINRKDGS